MNNTFNLDAKSKKEHIQFTTSAQKMDNNSDKSYVYFLPKFRDFTVYRDIMTTKPTDIVVKSNELTVITKPSSNISNEVLFLNIPHSRRLTGLVSIGIYFSNNPGEITLTFEQPDVVDVNVAYSRIHNFVASNGTIIQGIPEEIVPRDPQIIEIHNISGACLQSYPCQHECFVKFDTGDENYCLLSGRTIVESWSKVSPNSQSCFMNHFDYLKKK